MRKLLLLLLTTGLCLVAGATWAPAAGAHAALVASTPDELQILEAAPTSLVLAFDEEVLPALSTLRLTGPGAFALKVGPVTHGGQSVKTLAAPLTGALPAGDHTVEWRAVSVDDGHPTSGTFSFRTLQARRAVAATPLTTNAPDATAPAPQSSSRTTSFVFGLSRWLAFLGLAGAVGAAGMLALSRPGEHSRRPLGALFTGSCVVLGAGSVLTLLTYGGWAAGLGLRQSLRSELVSSTLATRTGASLLLRLALLAVVLLLAPPLARRVERWQPAVRLGAVLVVGTACALTWSAVSHSAGPQEPRAFAFLDAVHLTATGLWLGGLVALAVVVLRADREEEAGRLSRQFSRLALAAVAVMVGTGLVEGWRRVGSVAALGDNRYGSLLIAKGLLVLGILLLAAVARFVLMRRQAARVRTSSWRAALRRVVAAEAAVGAVVLAVTAALVTTEPADVAHAQVLAARGTSAASTTSATTPRTVTKAALSGTVPFDSGTGASGRGVVQVDLLSTSPGPTEIHLTVLSAAGAPQPLLRISSALRRAGGDGSSVPVTLGLLSPGHYVSSGTRLPSAGQWQLGIALQLPGGATAVAVAGVLVR